MLPSSLYSFLLPLTFLTVCLLLLVNMWSSATINRSLNEEAGRANSELDIVMVQSQYCSQELLDTETELRKTGDKKQSLKNSLTKIRDGNSKESFVNFDTK